MDYFTRQRLMELPPHERTRFLQQMQEQQQKQAQFMQRMQKQAQQARDARYTLPEFVDQSENERLQQQFQNWEGDYNLEQGEGLQAMRGEALRDPGTASAWASLMEQQQRLGQQDNMDAASRQAASGAAQARSSLAMRGGLSGGARERVAMNMGRGMAQDRQAAARQGMSDRLGIGMQDEQNRLGMLSQFANQEQALNQFNTGNRMQMDQFNVQGANQANMDNVNFARNEMGGQRAQDMEQWRVRTTAAEQAAKARADRREAAKAEKGGCCFIVLEADYPDGRLPESVRAYRDEHMTDRNRRGYYKMAEILVPMMRKSKLFKSLVKWTMVKPLVSFTEYKYGKGKFGKIMSPVVRMWLNTFEYLGGEHPFIRENGEVV